MTDLLADCTTQLIEILHRGVATENDFVALAVVGEEHRRTIALVEAPPDAALAAGARYDAVLAELHERWAQRQPTQVVSDGLDRDLAAAFADWTGVPGDLLDDVDQVLAVAAAATRVGALTPAAALALGAQATALATSLVAAHADLAEAAERRSFMLGDDDDLPGLYDYVEALAQWSTSRLALEDGMRARSASRRAALIAESLAGLAPPPERGRMIVEIALARRAPPVEPVLRSAAPAALGSDAGERATPIFEDDEIRVSWIEVPADASAEAASQLCLRVELARDTPGDLTVPDAVIVRSMDGATVRPLARSTPRPDLWWAYFAADEPLQLELPDRQLVIELHVVRPSR